MRKILLFLIISILCMGAPERVSAQELTLPVCPPTIVGSGARARGMGEAFVAIADDATAASWNPAGLVQLQKPEMSLVLSYERRSVRYDSKEYEESGGIIVRERGSDESLTLNDINYLSVVYPTCIVRRNVVFSLNYQYLYDFSRDFETEREWEYSGSGTSFLYSYHGEGGLYALSPAVAFQVTPNLYCGLTTNIWSDELTDHCNWTHTSSFDPNTNIPNNSTITTEKYHDFEAFNAHIGFFWMVNSYLTVAGVYKSPVRARLKREIDSQQHGISIPDYRDSYGDINRIRFPAVYGLGIAYRFSDALTISTDITRTEWDDFSLKNREGETFGLFTEFDSITNKPFSPKIKPTYALRFGAEYLKILEKTVIPLRVGLFYDPMPSLDNPLDSYGITLGSGISIGDLVLDVAYQYRFATKIPGAEAGLSELDQEINKKSHQVLLSGIYYF
ncbi:MAG: OmpP1/FadL family transporter [bacterium]